MNAQNVDNVIHRSARIYFECNATETSATPIFEVIIIFILYFNLFFILPCFLLTRFYLARNWLWTIPLQLVHQIRVFLNHQYCYIFLFVKYSCKKLNTPLVASMVWSSFLLLFSVQKIKRAVHNSPEIKCKDIN